jgi:xanthine dehydrogenase accessory factor
MEAAWRQHKLAVMLADDWTVVGGPAPDVVVDAILSKRNLGTTRDVAPLVIALGPGFTAGTDCHLVIETDRGHNLGRIITTGPAAPNTGLPGTIAGHTATRVLRAPAAGRFESDRSIGDRVREGEIVGRVGEHPVRAGVDGVLRGLIRPGTEIPAELKVGDIDPRGDPAYRTRRGRFPGRCSNA